MSEFNPALFRRNFPAMNTCGVYLDSAASALKPEAVIAATQAFYQTGGNVHRSQHASAQALTQAYENTRQQVANFIGSPNAQQIIWTKGTTESINLVATGWLAAQLHPGDEILVSTLEHHANLLPWLMLARSKGAKVREWPLDKHFLPDMSLLPQLLTTRTRLLAITQMSNVTGAKPDIPTITALAHQHGVKVLVDGAQGCVHLPCDIQQLGADFYAFSAHKLFGPTGLGVLWVEKDCLAQMQPVQGGGKMISEIDFDAYQLQPAPWCFEPGTPNIAAIIGFSAVIDFLAEWDWCAAERWVVSLANQAEQQLKQLPGFQSFRQPDSPLLAFQFEGLHHNDLITLLAEQQIAIRSGKLCAHPLLRALGVSGLLRASFAPYNNQQDVEALVDAVASAQRLLRE